MVVEAVEDADVEHRLAEAEEDVDDGDLERRRDNPRR